jgi:uncharacterized protein (TIGR02996 family)
MARFQREAEIRDVSREDDRYCARVSELLRAGWQRVRDPDREHDYPPDPPNAELERVLREHPDDTQALLVYADFLMHAGHPRGQLIALEAAPSKNTVDRAEREAEAVRLRAAATAVLEGPLKHRTGIGFRWRGGFIQAARIAGAFEPGDAEDLLFELLRHPSARMLRGLTIDVYHHDTQDHRLLVDHLLHAVPAPPLRSLALLYANNPWRNFAPIGEFGTVGSIYPQLERLHVHAENTMDLRGLAVPRCKQLSIRTVNMRPHTIEAIVDAPWPELEELELWFGDQSSCTAGDLRFVLDGTLHLPKLAKLRLRNCAFAYEVVAALLRSPLAQQLRTIDVGDRTTSDIAELLVPANFPQLVVRDDYW